MSDSIPAARRLLAPLGSAALVVGFAAWSVALAWDVSSGDRLFDAVIRLWGLLVLVLGLVVWLRTPYPRSGALIVLTAGLYYVNFLRGSPDPLLFAVGLCGAYAWTSSLGHILVTWPSGRATSWAQRWLVVACYGGGVGAQALRYVVDRPEPPMGFGREAPVTAMTQLTSVWGLLMGAAIAAYHVLRWWRGSPAGRPDARGLLLPMLGWFAVGLLMTVVSLRADWWRAQLVLMGAFLVGALVVGVLVSAAQHGRWLDVTVQLARVVLDQGRRPAGLVTPGDVQDALARAVGDPSLRLLFPAEGPGDPEPLGLVDVDGRFVDPDGPVGGPPAPGRARTVIGDAPRPSAVIEHDAALGPHLVEAAAAAAAVGVERAQLTALLRAQVQRLQEEQLRTAGSAAAERARIRRDLHDGAQQEHFAALVLLDTARRRLAGGGDPTTADLVEQAHERLSQAVAGLRRIIDGLSPSALLEHGLRPAVQDLVALSPVAVRLDVDGSRHRPEAELAGYFVVAEALANVYKHAEASQVSITIRDRAGALQVSVADDGRGGADPDGPGLRALADRVANAGGRLEVAPAAGRGSLVRAELAPEG